MWQTVCSFGKENICNAWLKSPRGFLSHTSLLLSALIFNKCKLSQEHVWPIFQTGVHLIIICGEN